MFPKLLRAFERAREARRARTRPAPAIRVYGDTGACAGACTAHAWCEIAQHNAAGRYAFAIPGIDDEGDQAVFHSAFDLDAEQTHFALNEDSDCRDAYAVFVLYLTRQKLEHMGVFEPSR